MSIDYCESVKFHTFLAIMIAFNWIIVLILVCIQSIPFTYAHRRNGASRNVNTESPLRLPTAFAPENYKLEITTFLDDAGEEHPFTFSGQVWIKVISSFELELLDIISNYYSNFK